jgi:hypothetical protein
MNLLCLFKHKPRMTKVATFTFWKTGMQCWLEDEVCERCGKVRNLKYDRDIVKMFWNEGRQDGWIHGLKEVVEGLKEA